MGWVLCLVWVWVESFLFVGDVVLYCDIWLVWLGIGKIDQGVVMNVYDIEIVNDVVYVGEVNYGWCFGLLLGICLEQWLLDLDIGYLLMYGFILLLLEDYWVYGLEIVVLSFFFFVLDQNDGGLISVDGICEMFIDLFV